jgi:hypothetical protein
MLDDPFADLAKWNDSVGGVAAAAEPIAGVAPMPVPFVERSATVPLSVGAGAVVGVSCRGGRDVAVEAVRSIRSLQSEVLEFYRRASSSGVCGVFGRRRREEELLAVLRKLSDDVVRVVGRVDER